MALFFPLVTLVFLKLYSSNQCTEQTWCVVYSILPLAITIKSLKVSLSHVFSSLMCFNMPCNLLQLPSTTGCFVSYHLSKLWSRTNNSWAGFLLLAWLLVLPMFFITADKPDPILSTNIGRVTIKTVKCPQNFDGYFSQKKSSKWCLII